MVFDRNFFFRERRNGKIRRGFFFVLLIFSIPFFLKAQDPSLSQADIHRFAEILQDQTTPIYIQEDDLTRISIQIIWKNPDRRAAISLQKRIASYVGESETGLTYRWTWPDETAESENTYTIVVTTRDEEIPAGWTNRKNFYFIGNSPVFKTGERSIYLPEFTPALLDLTAQYLFNGIEPDEENGIRTGSRMSFLSPEFFQLDGHTIREKLDSILRLGVDSQAYPGAQLIILYRGAVIYQKSVGRHTYGGDYLVRDHDIYDLASITKVTAGLNALMTLYDQNRLDVEAPLEEYLPYFRNTNKGPLSLKRLLTHSAGLTPSIVYYNMARDGKGHYAPHTISKVRYGEYTIPVTDSLWVSNRFKEYIYQKFAESELTAGHPYVYSDLFFLFAPDLTKSITGKRMDHFLNDRLYQPLGARNIRFNPKTSTNIHQIVPTEEDDFWRNQLVHGIVHDESAAVLGGLSGNAGLFSNALDLAKIAETWRRKGRYGGKKYWQESTIEDFTVCIYCDEGNQRALGFDRPPLPGSGSSYMSPLASQESFGHSGFTGTLVWIDPVADYTFVFLSNRVNPSRDHHRIYSLNIRPALHSVLYEALISKGLYRTD